MAAGAEVHSLTRPPPHLEGNLVFHRPAKFGILRSKRGFFVLLETVIHQYESESTYRKGHRSVKFEIRLEEVCGITEVLIPSKQYKNCSFSLTLNDSTEHTFSAESREAMEKWVNGLRAAKEFWAHYKRQEVKLKIRQSPSPHEDVVSVHDEVPKLDASSYGQSNNESKLIVQVLVTTWDGMTRKVLLPRVFDVEELLSALSGKLQGRRCAACPICKLQQTSMEVWTVNDKGVGKKLGDQDGALDVSKHGHHFYLLVHNYKLLIIHFEDDTFQVLPCLVSLKAKEVAYLPIFADKLSSLGFGNFGLFLVNEAGTSFLFDPEEEPLKHSFSGKLLLKNRALTVSSSVSPTRLDLQRKRIQNAQQNRKNLKALKKAEQEKCKQNDKFHVRNTGNTAFSSPHDLVFTYDRYSVADDQTRPLASNCAEHTNTALGLTNREPVSSSTDHNSVEDNQCSAEVSRSSVERNSLCRQDENSATRSDECVVGNNGTDSDVKKKGQDESTESGVVATKRCEGGERLVPQNEGNFNKSNLSTMPEGLHLSSSPNVSNSSPIMSNSPAKEESLELPKCSTNGGRSSQVMEESIRMENTHSSRDQCLSNDGDARQSRRGGELVFTVRKEKSDSDPESLTKSDMETKVETGMTSSKFVNHNNQELTFGDDTSHSQTCKLSNKEITSAKHVTNGSTSIDNHCAATNEKIPVQNDDASNIKASLPSTTSNDGQPLSSSFSSSSSSSLAKCDSLSDGCAAQLVRPIADPGETTELHSNLPGRAIFTGKETVCNERPPDKVHHCDYTIVGSPCVLELVLKVCSGHKVDEEEVGEANIFTSICLSGWHLRCENGIWSVVEQGRSPISSDNYSSTIKVRLTEGLEALFHKEEKSWTVIENQHVARESSVVTNPIQNQSLNCMLNVLEETSGDRDACKVGPDVMSLSVQTQENVTENPTKSNLETSKPSEAHTSPSVAASKSDQSPQGELHAAIQRIFHHMYKSSESPEQALDDSNDGIVGSVCEPLFTALWNVLSVGLRKKRFIGKHTVWDVVETSRDVSRQVRITVDWVNNMCAYLDEPQKFQVFVRECLNIGHGTLHLWLESLFKRKQTFAKYYSEEGVMFQLPRARLEEIVLDLSRISSLPFKLHSKSLIKLQGNNLNGPAFTFE